MASGIAITPEKLREIAVQMNTGAADLKAILSVLANDVAPIQSEWVGSAQLQFNALWDRLQRDAAGLQSVLAGIANLTESAATTYAATEESIAKTFDQFRAELDRLSERLGPDQEDLPSTAPVFAPKATATEEGTGATAIDHDLADDAIFDEPDQAVSGSQETVRTPWARFMAPAAQRGSGTSSN